MTACSAMRRASACVSFSMPGPASTTRPPHANALNSSCSPTAIQMHTYVYSHKWHDVGRHVEGIRGCLISCLHDDRRQQGRTWTEASKLMGAFCRKASAGVSFSLLHKTSEVSHSISGAAPGQACKVRLFCRRLGRCRQPFA